MSIIPRNFRPAPSQPHHTPLHVIDNQCSDFYHNRLVLPVLELHINGVVQFVLLKGLAFLAQGVFVFYARFGLYLHFSFYWWILSSPVDQHLGCLQVLSTQN